MSFNEDLTNTVILSAYDYITTTVTCAKHLKATTRSAVLVRWC